ncbi:MAG: DNA replication/repair protein RecF [Chlamydiota bacterium]
MFLHKLTLSSFRSYKTADALFTQGINYIEGMNGSGKSNLLEALHLISTGKSFRTSRLQELIRHTQEKFILEALFYKEGIDHKLTLFFSKEGRKILYNETSYSSFIPLLGLIPSIFSSPEDITIITGGPAERRRFLDLHIAQADPNYIYHLGRYQRALKQRNFLLKTQTKGFAPWEELMATSACYITEKRVQTLFDLQKASQKFLLHLSEQKEPLQIEYRSSLHGPKKELTLTPGFYIEKWAELRSKELIYKTTLIGPHRDDILFSIQGQDVKSFCSEGQKRCALAALRLAEWETLKNRLGITPLFGVDDFGVHLDEKRTFLLDELLQDMGQVFLTAPTFKNKDKGHFIHTTEGSLLSGVNL